MEIKCMSRTFTVGTKDLILDNDACYTLITQPYYKGYYQVPVVAKTLFKKLLKDGKIRLSKKVYKSSYSTTSYPLYEFTED